MKKRSTPIQYQRMGRINDNLRIAPIVIREVGNEWAQHYLRDVKYLLDKLNAILETDEEEPPEPDPGR